MSYQRKSRMISDSPSEDKGYNRTHRQTVGGREAYLRGEMPLSYWKKDKILKAVEHEFLKAKRESKYAQKYKDFISYMGMSSDKIIEQLGKLTTPMLKDNLLEIRGSHYTGNYYRYTLFYGIINVVSIFNRIKSRKLVERVTVEQLKLELEF